MAMKKEFLRALFTLCDPPFRQTWFDTEASSIRCPRCRHPSFLDAVMTAATGCVASALVSAFVLNILKRLMAKGKPKKIETGPAPAPRKRANSSLNSKRKSKATCRRWDPAGISAKFTPPDTVLENEVKTVEVFLKEQINEFLGRGELCTNKPKEKFP